MHPRWKVLERAAEALYEERESGGPPWAEIRDDPEYAGLVDSYWDGAEAVVRALRNNPTAEMLSAGHRITLDVMGDSYTAHRCFQAMLDEIVNGDGK